MVVGGNTSGPPGVFGGAGISGLGGWISGSGIGGPGNSGTGVGDKGGGSQGFSGFNGSKSGTLGVCGTSDGTLPNSWTWSRVAFRCIYCGLFGGFMVVKGGRKVGVLGIPESE